MIDNKFDLAIFGGGIIGTWIAKKALEKGMKVCVIDSGPLNPGAKIEPIPKLNFPQKKHLGAIEARNHCLTGNSRFWGGGLISNDIQSLKDILNIDSSYSTEKIDHLMECSKKVAEELNITLPKRKIKLLEDNLSIIVSEIMVLSGKRRDLWNNFYKKNKNNSLLKVFTDSKISELEFTGQSDKINSVEIFKTGFGRENIIAKEFILSNGVIDSIIFAKEKLSHLLRNSNDKLGTHLHDHWSLPIGKIKWNKELPLDLIFPPYFDKGHILGRRLEIRGEKLNSTSGFIHIQPSYDTTPPYSILKKILFHHQNNLSAIQLYKDILGLVPYSPSLIHLGWQRLMNDKLFIPDDTEVNIVLDFESCGDKQNRLEPCQNNYDLFWDIREKDIESFNELYLLAIRSITSLLKGKSTSKNISILSDWTNDFENYLRTNSIDAYHLGGGLNYFVDGESRFNGINNLSVLGTSVFNKPGIANPVFTLLSLAERYVDRI